MEKLIIPNGEAPVPNGDATVEVIVDVQTEPEAPRAMVDVTFEIAGHALTTWNNNIYVVGSLPELGAWEPARSVRLLPAAYPVWGTTVALPVGEGFEYKYICRTPGKEVVWEDPPFQNRSARTPKVVVDGGVTVRDAWY